MVIKLCSIFPSILARSLPSDVHIFLRPRRKNIFYAKYEDFRSENKLHNANIIIQIILIANPLL